MVIHVTDTQLIEIPVGGLTIMSNQRRFQAQRLIINQGGLNTVSNGTGVVQPLTQLFRVKAANDVARAEVEATRGKARGVEHTTALMVRQVYYRMLIADVRRRAALAKIQASEDLQRERESPSRCDTVARSTPTSSRAARMRCRPGRSY